MSVKRAEDARALNIRRFHCTLEVQKLLFATPQGNRVVDATNYPRWPEVQAAMNGPSLLLHSSTNVRRGMQRALTEVLTDLGLEDYAGLDWSMVTKRYIGADKEKHLGFQQWTDKFFGFGGNRVGAIIRMVWKDDTGAALQMLRMQVLYDKRVYGVLKAFIVPNKLNQSDVIMYALLRLFRDFDFPGDWQEALKQYEMLFDVGGNGEKHDSPGPKSFFKVFRKLAMKRADELVGADAVADDLEDGGGDE